jgi:Tfp pilus assembly protein PilO
MKFQASPKMFMGLAAFALLGGGIGSYLQWSKLQDLTADSEAIRLSMKDPADVNRQLEQTTAQVGEFAAKLSHLEKGVPQMAYMATMLAELDQLGTQSGIQVLGVRPIIQAAPVAAQKTDGESKSIERKAYQELNIEVKGRGDYRAVMNFVQALQTFPKIVAARTISITPKVDSQKGERKLDITIELRAYLFPTPDAGKARKVASAGEESPANG